MRGAYPPSALPGISPTRGEIGKKRYRHFILQLEMGETLPHIDLPTCGGDARQGRGGRRHAPSVHSQLTIFTPFRLPHRREEQLPAQNPITPDIS